MKISEVKKTVTKVFWLHGFIFFLAAIVLPYQNVNAQTYALQDTSFRNKLLASYPSVMSGNLLNIAAAGSLTGTLNLSSSTISNADGIQYFTNISILNLSNNKLTVLPDISGLTQLLALYLSYNTLTTIPPLSSFSNLVDFQAAYNQLTSLPSLSGNTNLMYIYCQNNKLTSFPDISLLTNLRVLDIGANNLNQLQDLSSLVTLEELHVHLTGIDTIIGLSALSNLKKIYAWGNKIRDLSGLDANTTLVLFQVFNNDLKSLPVLTNKSSLTTVSFVNNRLSFEDLLPLSSHPAFGSFSYNPQKSIPLSSYSVREKDNVTFDLSIDPVITSNLYTWYKEGNILTTNQTGVFPLTNISYADAGKYNVEITNPGLMGLTLQSDTANLQVKACLEINNITIEYLSGNCQEGLTIELADLDLGGGTEPFTFGIVKSNKTDTIFTSTKQFSSITSGIYSVIIKDFKTCQASKNITVKKLEGCDNIISPNGDGIMDTYFIEEPGVVKIFDLRRNLVKELKTPAEWDGRKSDGTLADDGYYAMVLNEKKVIHITLVK